MINTILLKLGTRLLKKVNFRKWATLEDLKFSFIEAVEDNSPNLPELLRDYITTALCVKVNLDKVFWQDEIISFYKIHDVTSTTKKIPLTVRKPRKESEKESWDYPGRLWFFYSSTIASAFGWSNEEIANLSVDDALSYIQEILTTQYLEREFIWSTTEIAYVYNKQSKKSTYTHLPKPYWMLPDMNAKNNKRVVPVPKNLLPIGQGVNLNEIE